jgi:uncharacterized protein (TIGR00251 family)
VTLRVRVQPRASREGLAGVRAGALVVRLAAPPVEGQANDALVRYLGRLLGLPASSVSLQQGAHGREKVLLLSGMTVETARARLAALLGQRA